ncbi:MAG: hypothetical protein COT85_06695 [Chlamydiae bacterium CG10_big_fil_rev_8_21_14_0_10_42_34]|nr:MAG: hypothetical protein COT85_06695 [Chlamydiae bacterium CG10_big_fil_rev_8_21_14_0_10_42_34]
MVPTSSYILSQKILQLDPSLQRVIRDIDQEKPLGYWDQTKDLAYYVCNVEYRQIRDAQTSKVLRIFANMSCFFDHTEKKVGNISGDYLTLEGRKIFYQVNGKTFFLKRTDRTRRFELQENKVIVEHYQVGEKLASRIFKTFNDIHYKTVEGHNSESCIRAVLKT